MKGSKFHTTLMSDSNLGIEYTERNKIYSLSKEFPCPQRI